MNIMNQKEISEHQERCTLEQVQALAAALQDVLPPHKDVRVELSAAVEEKAKPCQMYHRLLAFAYDWFEYGN